MPLTIVATSGAANANSFVTAAEMTTYCEGRLNATAWSATDAQLPALVEATRDLTLYDYVGKRASGTQSLAWPRVWAENPDAPTTLVDPGQFIPIGQAAIVYYGETVIPQRVKDATCELALEYLKAGSTDLAVADTSAGVIRKKTDVLETEWASPQSRPTGMARFPRVLNILQPILRGRAGLQLVRV